MIMPDWRASMQRTYEFYIVDPVTWKDMRRIDTVKSCTLNWDSETETLLSATIDINEAVGECYVRVYMIIIQNGVKDKKALGTVLVQTPSSSFNGKVRSVSMDAYSPLIELKEKMPPIGYFISKDDPVLERVGALTDEHTRAAVVHSSSERKMLDDFLAETNDTWLSYLTSALASVKHSFDLDEYGKVSFAPKQDIESLQPVWTYTDDNSSILYPEINLTHDLYGIPNVVEVVYSTPSGSYHVIKKNTDPDSPTSIPRRGREIVHRVTDPDLHDVYEDAPEGSDLTPEEYQLETYAEELLKKLSTVEYSISYTHAYCPVRIGDCVRLNYERAGLIGIKAKVVSQSIRCTPECPVSEKAVFTAKLWR